MSPLGEQLAAVYSRIVASGQPLRLWDEIDTLRNGGKPSPGTPKDKRLGRNKPKGGKR